MAKYIITILFAIALIQGAKAQTSARIGLQIDPYMTETVTKPKVTGWGAFGISVASTVVTTAIGYGFTQSEIVSVGSFLSFLGLIIAPSIGNFIAEDYRNAATFIGIRTLGFALAVGGSALVASIYVSNALNPTAFDYGIIILGAGLGISAILGGVTMILTSVVKDWTTGKKAVDRRNQKLQLTPSVDTVTGTPLMSFRFNF